MPKHTMLVLVIGSGSGPAAEYNPKDDLLDEEFLLKGKWYHRKDLEVMVDRLVLGVAFYVFSPIQKHLLRQMMHFVLQVKNSRGDVLLCSHYMPVVPPEGKTLPCVIYCHGNSGCRTDASEAAVILLPSNITVFALDFSGSGLSGGEHVTLGWNEKDDLKAVVNYLREDGNVSLIGLWGRSMGAVTSLMYGAEDPSIAGMVLDSPFSDLVDLMMELVDTYKVRLPKFTVKFAIQYMRKAIQRKAKFDIMELNTIKVAKSCFVPVLFGHAIEDDFIQPHHSDSVFDAYVVIISPCEIFFPFLCFASYIGRWSTIQDSELSDELLGSPSGPPATSTEDAIRQLRSRRPMSATVVPADISSKDNRPDSEVESRSSDAQPSTSNMISLEFSRDSPHGSLGLGSVDDDEYVEYSLDMLAEFPSNVEEEERMLMVAIFESLKDSKESSSGVGGSSFPNPEPAPKDEAEGTILQPETSSQNPPSSKAEHSKTCSPSDDTPKADTSTVSNAGAPHPKQEETTSQIGAPSDNHRPSDVDMADRTKVTVEVEKNPTANIIDGLLRRWDIFRNR
ncbi:hypothetical protein SASPL_100383 [Salvia splendens]|uniref:Serine aminopeptidase S33 domain-containing protein n=1 Tax=Salvia splendens TaxID=180675 RepID=A0A8X9AD54_SALSN|nr:hypothetical protein SASPL_100383 [Salvia splendens]